MTTPLRDFLEIPYDKLEEMNLQIKADRIARTPADKFQEARMKDLADEKRIKAVTVCFSDLLSCSAIFALTCFRHVPSFSSSNIKLF